MGGHSVQVGEDFILEMTFENNSEKGRVGSFPGGPVANSLASNAGDTGWIPGWESSSGGGDGNPLQYSSPENRRDRGTLAGYSPWSRKVSDATERLGTHAAEVTPSIGPSVAV